MRVVLTEWHSLAENKSVRPLPALHRERTMQTRFPKRIFSIAVVQTGMAHRCDGDSGPAANFSLLADPVPEAAASNPDLISLPGYATSSWSNPDAAESKALAESLPGSGRWQHIETDTANPSAPPHLYNRGPDRPNRHSGEPSPQGTCQSGRTDLVGLIAGLTLPDAGAGRCKLRLQHVLRYMIRRNSAGQQATRRRRPAPPLYR